MQDSLTISTRRPTSTPTTCAVIDGDVRMSFAEARDTVHAIATALARARDGGAGSHVAIYAPNDHRVSLLQLGANLADMAWLSIHIRNTVETNADVLDYFDASIVFFSQLFRGQRPGLEGQTE